MITLQQCFSALVASGCGQRCNDLKEMLHVELLSIDEGTGQSLSTIYKYGKTQHPELHKKLREDVADIVRSQIYDVDVFYFGEDFHNARVVR